MKRLNLGCGKDIKQGYVNLDVVRLPGVDVVHNINKFPWPFKNNEFDEVLAKDVLEHTEDFNKSMKELHRVIKPGGTAKITVPYFTCRNAFGDPTHKHFFTYGTFDFFLKGWKMNYYYDFSFNKIRKRIVFEKKYEPWNWLIELFANWFPNVYEASPLRIFPAVELHVELIK